MPPSRITELAATLRLPSSLDELSDARLRAANVRLWLKRDDLVHPDLPGNKWRKLKYNVQAATDQGYDSLLTFGGAYSNHIRAVAAAGAFLGVRTIGVIRGEEHRPLNPSLTYAAEHGMRLTYLDREAYRQKTSPSVVEQLGTKFGDFYLLPEGGSNELAVRGCAELPAETEIPFDVICCAVGTGGTLAGIAAGLDEGQSAVGFSALKGGEFLNGDVATLQRQTYGRVTNNWRIECRYHFGGYAKRSPELDHFVQDFEMCHGIVLDWVYVAKMLAGLFEMISLGEFPAGTRIVAVVTGSAQ